MAVVGKNGFGKFFIYDHNKLQKERDDLKDAIIYFYPVFTNADEQCALCGQLMGISEFLQVTISESVPTIFKLQSEKYALKRIGHYSMGLEGSLNESDFHLKEQLKFLYEAFVMFCGSFQNIHEQFEGDHEGFVFELQKIWKVLYPSASLHNNFISQVFQVLPTVYLPRSSSDLFCQASDILQSSLRRPGVHVGAILFKNKVLCSQMSPELARKLVLVKPELPSLHLKTDFGISRSIRLITIYLTLDEMKAIDKTFKPLVRHNQSSKFVWHDHSKNKMSVPDTNNTENCPMMKGKLSSPTKHVLSPHLGTSRNEVEKTLQAKLSWTVHSDQSESPEIESRKLSDIKKDDIVETISDLEENENGYTNQNNRHLKNLVEKRDHIIDISDGHVIIRNQVNIASINQKDNQQQHIVEAEVHESPTDISVQVRSHVTEKSESEIIQKPCHAIESTDLQENETSIHDSVLNTENISSGEINSRTLIKNCDTSTCVKNIKNSINVDNLPFIKITPDERDMKNLDGINFRVNSDMSLASIEATPQDHDTNLVDASNFDGGGEVKVDYLRECSCGCEKAKTKDLPQCDIKHFNDCDHNIQSSTNDLEENSNADCKENQNMALDNVKDVRDDDNCDVNVVDKQMSSSTECIPDDYMPEFKIDEISNQNVNENVISPQELSQDRSDNLNENVISPNELSPDGSDKLLESSTAGEVSEESSVGDGSLSDIASPSTSRRKEKFVFQSSADESSSEYSLFPKRTSFDSSGRKMSKLFRSTENNADTSNNSSLQNTLKNSGTFSLQSSIGQLSSHSSEVEVNVEQNWHPGQDNLYEMTLYVQGQSSSQSSDLSLMLIIDNSLREDKSVIHSLWKHSLSQLADLEFYVRESVEEHLDEGFMESKSYIKYDTFSHKIKGNEVDVPVNVDFQKLAGEIHKDYQQNKDISSIALTSHLCSCNSSRDKTNELYFHVDGQNTNR